MLFRIRIDVEGVDPGVCPRSQVIEQWVKQYEHVLVHHVLGTRNPHYHIFLDAPYNSVQSCRYHVDKMSGAKGPARSVVECTETRRDEYIQYLFNRKKGNVPTLRSSTIDTTEHQQRALDVKEEYDAAREEKKKMGPSGWDLAQETVALVNSRMEEDRICKEYLVQEYIRACIDVHRKHKKAYCDFSLLKVVTTALGETPTGRQAIVDRLCERLSPR